MAERIGATWLAWLFVSGSVALGADDREGRFAIRGPGLMTCEIYVEERERKSNAYYLFGGWIDGYITALNQFSDDTYDITSFESTELFALLIDTHCRSNPKDKFFSVLNTILQDVRADRLRESSQFVDVKVGAVQGRLYQETLRRLQAELKKRGHYKGAIDGSFSTDLFHAIREYQQASELEDTGLPDQNTLWRIFREKK